MSYFLMYDPKYIKCLYLFRKCLTKENGVVDKWIHLLKFIKEQSIQE